MADVLLFSSVECEAAIERKLVIHDLCTTAGRTFPPEFQYFHGVSPDAADHKDTGSPLNPERPCIFYFKKLFLNFKSMFLFFSSKYPFVCVSLPFTSVCIVLSIVNLISLLLSVSRCVIF